MLPPVLFFIGFLLSHSPAAVASAATAAFEGPAAHTGAETVVPPEVEVLPEITPQFVLAQLEAARERLDNISLKATWTELTKGAVVATERQTIDMDGLGRIRVRLEYDQQGRKIKHVDDIFDGEMTSNAVEDPNLNRMGLEQDGAQDQGGDEPYLVAFINEGLYPPGTGPANHRNPFTFNDEWVISSLRIVVSTGAAVAVSRPDPSAGIYELRFQLPPEEDPEQMWHIVVLDSDRGWVVRSHEQAYPKDGKLSARRQCEYAADPNGVWLPKRGTWQHWGVLDPAQPPEMEWRYDVDEIHYNDPEFDENVFTVKIKPGTYVTDNRYHTAYWVGAEEAIGAELTELAQSATARQAAQLERLNAARQAGGPPGPGGSKLLWILNVLIVMGILGVLWYRRRLAR